MSDDLEEFIADIPNMGVDTRSMDFVTVIDMDSDSNNVTAGILRGQSPRYGMSPIVSQNVLLNAASTTNPVYGIYGSSISSSATTQAVYGLYRVYAIVPVQLLDQSYIGQTTTNIPKKTYFFVVGMIKDTSGTWNNYQLLQVMCLGQMTGANLSTYRWSAQSGLAYGLMRPFIIDNGNTVSTATSPTLEHMTIATTTGLASYCNIDVPSGFVDYAQVAVMTVPGIKESAAWLFGNKNPASPPTSTSAGVQNFGQCPPNFVIDRNFPQTQERTWSIYNTVLGGTNGLVAQYKFTKTPTATDLLSQLWAAPNGVYPLTGTFITGGETVVTPLAGAPGSYAADYGLWNDEANYFDTAHSLILTAARKPLAMILQGWSRGESYSLEQWVDLRNRRFQPPVLQTLSDAGGGAFYTEATNGIATSTIQTNTCWYKWPVFARGTALATDAASARNGTLHVRLGAANTGILRANTVYEFAYSVYDKKLGVESNVGKPAKVQTGTDDFVAISLYRDSVTAGVLDQKGPWFYILNLPIAQSPLANGNGSVGAVINYVQFRIYYRPEGSFEWLPALFVDAAKLLYYPNFGVLWMCQGAVPGSTGGQPGAFNDYSDLPDDNYTSVLIWKNRVFWLSDKNLYYSLTNNGFNYPVRNSITVPQGAFKGALVHNYPGQADQDSRLIVFGTKDIYVGKFTGVRQQQWVQVSADDGGVFDVDGSDFVLNAWTSITAFSYRSACVADGILYYWGPQGVYRDDGRDTPTKISDQLEPHIFTLYAKKNTDDIHCTYSEQSKEIIWFYFKQENYEAVNADNPQTYMLIYNTQTEEFSFGSMRGCVEASQKINVGDSVDLLRKTSGDRTVVFARNAKADTTDFQLAYFFDTRNRAGDMIQATNYMVSQVATPATGTRRLTLPNGGASNISVGNYISTDQIREYTNNTDSSSVAITVEDFVGIVTAVNTSGTHYIDVTIPSDLTMSTAFTLDHLGAFPIYVGKTIYGATPGNAFPFELQTTYWCPNGLLYNAFWKYLHFLFKVELLKAEGLSDDYTAGVDFSFRVPTATDWEPTRELIFGTMVDGVWTSDLNTTGHMQIYHPLEPADGVYDGFEGQGVKFKLSGLHYAHKWVLQYLAAFASPQKYDFLKRFEG